MTMSKKQTIFSPIQIGHVSLQHRVVLAPLTRFRATMDAIPTDLMTEYYTQRTTEGGLLITEATFIDRLAGGYKQAPGIYNKDQINAWKKITSAVHNKKGSIFLQLWHIGRAGSMSLNPNGEQTVSASAISIEGKSIAGQDYEVPRPLLIEEIHVIVGQYRQAALNAIQAGFDGVEIHSANGYLLDQFINSGSNHRTDIYGGSIPNRARFSLQVLDAVVEALGPQRVAMRFSPGGEFQGMQDDTVVDTWSYLTTEIQKKHPHLAYLHFIESRANIHSDTAVSTVDTLTPYRRIWKGPFITASGFSHTPQHAIDLSEKTGDLIAFGRAFIANPDLVKRLQHGWELNKYNRKTFYDNHDFVGYTDYPFYSEEG